eukprot:CAMPEP_0178378160 /NCGR_PEP_ID=MMETSP0689_2-20121128/4284_1 /TAXON_ID=160604 /ORGANISM="Amphidinium massartii, Strain CS-259" /LENGTH=499 /DNA_ID=CAMNT_0019998223 /DNA_START=72 /DNA_END=1567 /DNA_ORIENTATION=+
MCALGQKVQQGEVLFEDALQGLHLNVVANLYYEPWFHEDETGHQSGFHMDILRELATRAGFNYTVHVIDTAALGSNFSWTDLLVNSTRSFDVSMDSWIVVPQRIALGLRPPYSFLDRTLVTAKHSEEEETSLQDDLTAWSLPFTPALWMTFVAVSIGTAFLYFGLEAEKNTEDLGGHHRGAFTRFLDAQYLGLVLFTQSGGYAPHTGWGKLLVLTYSFMILLLISSYTANLAATLVTVSRAKGCSNLDLCLAQGKKVCVQRATAYDEWLTTSNAFPYLRNDARVVRTNDEPFTGLAEGRCEVVLESKESFEASLLRSDVNADCNLEQVGSDLKHFLGGWMGFADHYTHCTSLLLDALGVHILTMELDGTLEQITRSLHQVTATRADCQEQSSQDQTGSSQYDVRQMMGAFTIHFVKYGFGHSAHLAEEVLPRMQDPADEATKSRQEMMHPVPSAQAEAASASDKVLSVKDIDVEQLFELKRSMEVQLTLLSKQLAMADN